MPLPDIQPERYHELLAEKVRRKLALFAGLDLPEPRVHASPPLHYRMRCEFRMWHDDERLDYVMFDPEHPKLPVPIRRFPIADARIDGLMPVLRERLAADGVLRERLFQTEFLATVSGDVLVTLIYHRRLDERWRAAADELRRDLGIDIVGRARRQKIAVERDFVEERFDIAGRYYRWRQPEGTFTQPNAHINGQIMHWLDRVAVDHGRPNLLELYCGNGNFTIPQARRFPRVLATEVSKASVAAARANILTNGCDNIDMLRMSSEEFGQAWRDERPFRRLSDIDLPGYGLATVLVDPPRAGLDTGTLELVSGFERIFYVSCNPATLAANLRVLADSHRVVDFALFDQFPYTDHLECAVALARRDAG